MGTLTYEWDVVKFPRIVMCHGGSTTILTIIRKFFLGLELSDFSPPRKFEVDDNFKLLHRKGLFHNCQNPIF